MSDKSVEPWLRGTLLEVDPVRRAVLHALQLASEDAERWCAGLTQEQMFARPHGLPSVAFQLRHIARSLDRLLTYVEENALTAEQHNQLQSEMDEGGTCDEVMQEFVTGLHCAAERIRAISPESFEQERGVGRARLPTTVAGLLIHCAEHTQRHAGQMVTTAKVARPA